MLFLLDFFSSIRLVFTSSMVLLPHLLSNCAFRTQSELRVVLYFRLSGDYRKKILNSLRPSLIRWNLFQNENGNGEWEWALKKIDWQLVGPLDFPNSMMVRPLLSNGLMVVRWVCERWIDKANNSSPWDFSEPTNMTGKHHKVWNGQFRGKK